MDLVLVIGRVLFALIFVASGFMAHLVGEGAKQGREYARSLGAPAPDLLVPLSGLVAVAGGAWSPWPAGSWSPSASGLTWARS